VLLLPACRGGLPGPSPGHSYLHAARSRCVSCYVPSEEKTTTQQIVSWEEHHPSCRLIRSNL